MLCKVYCNYKRPLDNGGGYLDFTPVYNGSAENKEFFKYTPGGDIKFFVVSQEAYDKFEVGEEYYLEFKPADLKSTLTT